MANYSVWPIPNTSPITTTTWPTSAVQGGWAIGTFVPLPGMEEKVDFIYQFLQKYGPVLDDMLDAYKALKIMEKDNEQS